MYIAYHQNLGLRVNNKKKKKKGGDYDKNGMEGCGVAEGQRRLYVPKWKGSRVL